MYSLCVIFFKQKTAYEMRISDWSPDVCSSDLLLDQLEPWAPPPSLPLPSQGEGQELAAEAAPTRTSGKAGMAHQCAPMMRGSGSSITPKRSCTDAVMRRASASSCAPVAAPWLTSTSACPGDRSEEPTSELQSLMPTPIAV